jgi:hypothetical protein
MDCRAGRARDQAARSTALIVTIILVIDALITSLLIVGHTVLSQGSEPNLSALPAGAAASSG